MKVTLLLNLFFFGGGADNIMDSLKRNFVLLTSILFSFARTATAELVKGTVKAVSPIYEHITKKGLIRTATKMKY